MPMTMLQFSLNSSFGAPLRSYNFSHDATGLPKVDVSVYSQISAGRYVAYGSSAAHPGEQAPF